MEPNRSPIPKRYWSSSAKINTHINKGFGGEEATRQFITSFRVEIKIEQSDTAINGCVYAAVRLKS
ncbi:hypothetical protein CASFOL_021147 [Castilleja foliolosa]|uniref:Uncharacterized protein n=1 Tax=Castilleja foliolosa TaxID=1961234 RepID=A0ABD3CVQ4_9LAMI